jgi:hypothetical protein
MIRRAKIFELMKFVFITDLNTFGSTLKIMDFENVPLTKVVHIYVIDNINIHYIKFICNQNSFMSKM